MLRPNNLKVLKTFLVVLVCAGVACLPFLIDGENRNVELGKADRARRTRPALRSGGIVIRTPFRTPDPYIEYVNQLTPVLTPMSDWSLLRIYSGQRVLTPEESSAIEDAIQHWRSVLDLMPFDDGASENLSRLYLFAGQKSDALAAAGRAVTLRPGDYSHLVNLGLVNESLGNKNEALSAYARALAIHPRLIQSPFWLELTERDQRFAHEVLSTAVQNQEDAYKSTEDVIENERLARLLTASGDQARAAQIVAAILKASPELEGAWELNGELTEDRNAAILSYRKASFLDPSDPLPHARLGDLELANHNVSSAATEWFTAWTLHKAIRTPHSEIAKVRYRLPVDISNDAIPGNWIDYISPAFAFSSAFSIIADSYETSGHIKEATIYRNLALISGRSIKGVEKEE